MARSRKVDPYEGIDDHLRSVPTDGPIDFAARAFEHLDEAQTVFRRAEIRRVESTLGAFRTSMNDASERFGPDEAWRGGAAGRAFVVDLADSLQMTKAAAAHLLDTALRLESALPKTFYGFCVGWVTWRAAEVAVQQAQGLDDGALPAYDREAAEAARRTNPALLKKKLHRIRESVQADTATARHRLAEAERRVEIEPQPDGMAGLHVYGPAAEIVAMHSILTSAAVAAHGVAGEDRSLGNLRFDVLADLVIECGQADANEAQSLGVRVKARKGFAPKVFLTVPVLNYLGGDEPADLEGYGPIDPETARTLTARAPSLYRILTHPVTGTRMAFDRTTYRVPPDLRRYLELRDGTCQEPGCTKSASECDADHTKAWNDSGGTNEDNLAMLCRPSHLMKHDGLWDVVRDEEGVLVWTSPWGRKHYAEPAEWATLAAIASAPVESGCDPLGDEQLGDEQLDAADLHDPVPWA